MITDNSITDQDIENWQKDRQQLHWLASCLRSLSSAMITSAEQGSSAFDATKSAKYIETFVDLAHDLSSKTTRF